MLMPCQQTAEIANMAKSMYVGTVIIEIKSKLNWKNACCHSVQNLLSSRLLSETVEFKT
jgi:hypothetical protein